MNKKIGLSLAVVAIISISVVGTLLATGKINFDKEKRVESFQDFLSAPEKAGYSLVSSENICEETAPAYHHIWNTGAFKGQYKEIMTTKDAFELFKLVFNDYSPEVITDGDSTEVKVFFEKDNPGYFYFFKTKKDCDDYRLKTDDKTWTSKK